jgi:regulator of protease activity HflC (stomatin/prohibitin superfamily)
MPSYDAPKKQGTSLAIVGVAIVLLIVFLIVGRLFVTRVSPDAGVAAVLVEKPILFGHGGVNPTPVTTGSSYVAWTTEPVYVDLKPIQKTVDFQDLMSQDGIPLHFDSTIRMQVTDPVRLVSTFGPGWYDSNVDSEFRNRVRQAVRKHGMNETAISTTAIDAIDAEVTDQMQRYIRSSGLPIRLIKITVGRASPPDSIKNQRIATASEQQRQITEAQTQKAEVTRKGAEEARADADNAYRQRLGLDAQQFVELQHINMLKDVCRPREDDKDSRCTFVVGSGTAMVNVK